MTLQFLAAPERPLETSKTWNTSLPKAGIADFQFHDACPCAGSYFKLNGVGLAENGGNLRHEDVPTTKRYAHLAEGHTEGIVNAMNGKIFR